MATPFPFVAGAVLEAAELNAITTLPFNDQTANYTLVVGDVGKRVVMNVASANTVTVNNSIFDVGDTVEIVNKGAGVSTVTAGAGVTINTSDSLALAQYQSGTLVALSASTFLFFTSAETAPASALTLISNTVIGSSVTSVTVSSAFSSTYDNYKITITGGVAAAQGNITMQLGSTTTGYYMSADRTSFGGVENLNGYANQANWTVVGGAQTDVLGLNIDLLGPNLAKKTLFMGIMIDPGTTGVAGNVGGFLNNSTQYTAFTVSGATFTGGNIRVYGYANS
jgi:hypothetical protein